MSSHPSAPVPADISVTDIAAADPAPVPADLKVTVIVAPDRDTKPVGRTVFLAGSIDQGAVIDWQNATIRQFKDHKDVTIYSPRRANWDAGWKQDASFPPFREQVEWELDALNSVDVIMMYLVGGSKSPISLLELGIYAADANSRMVVCCPKGFYRRGNVEIVCERNKVKLVETFEELLEETKRRLLKPANGK